MGDRFKADFRVSPLELPGSASRRIRLVDQANGANR